MQSNAIPRMATMSQKSTDRSTSFYEFNQYIIINVLINKLLKR